MDENRKYAGLSDIDTSEPYIFETTPANDPSTSPNLETTGLQSPSSTSSGSGSPGSKSGVHRGHVKVAQARKRFRLAQSRQSVYRFSGCSHAEHTSKDDYLDISGNEHETLENRLARIQNELEEVKLELEQRQKDKTRDNGDDQFEESLEGICDLLDLVYSQRHGAFHGAQAQLKQSLARFSKASTLKESEDAPSLKDADSIPTPVISPMAQAQRSHVLQKIADFDSRLTSLETALGFNAANAPDVAEAASTPILQTLDRLDKQLSIISQASTSSLDATSQKVFRYSQEADSPEKLHGSSKKTRTPVVEDCEGGRDSDDQQLTSKIDALYEALSTIDRVSPTLPMVLERLRTLRIIHTSAGTASTTLGEIEKSQQEQDSEINQWKEALDNLETSLKEGGDQLKKNMTVVEVWVRDLEARISKFNGS